MKKRIYSLDFLRIPAAMMIVMHHFQQAFSAFFPNHINYFGGRFSFGYVVEFFFVLSGLLMLPAVRKIYSGEITFGEFAFRRARRLLPMLAVCAIAYDAVEIISWAQSGFNEPLRITLLMTVADMLGIQSGWCFQTAEVNIPSWYACVLLLCYVLLFALVRLCGRKRWQVEYACAGMVLLGCGVFSFGFELPFLNYASSRGFYSFFFGVLLALLNEKYDLQKPKYRIISLAMLLFAVFDIMRGRGSGAGYNLKCNTRNKKRQYANLGVKCSYHKNKLHGGKHIVLHTFYTGRKKISTKTFVRRPEYSKNFWNSGAIRVLCQSGDSA